MESRDILNMVLAISAAVLTVFIATLLYYVIRIFKDLRETTRAVHDKVEEVGTILNAIRERISESTSTLGLMAQVIAKVARTWRGRRSKKTAGAGEGEVG